MDDIKISHGKDVESGYASREYLPCPRQQRRKIHALDQIDNIDNDPCNHGLNTKYASVCRKTTGCFCCLAWSFNLFRAQPNHPDASSLQTVADNMQVIHGASSM
ncbi:hypothetical protein ACMFMG_002249 [Clarireedia jacksonii]